MEKMEENMEKIDIETLQNMHPHDLSELFLKWDTDERHVWMSRLSSQQLAEMFTYLEPEIALEFLDELDHDSQAELIDLMEPDDA
ncbi:MAG: hypothetical protein GX777_08135, partial [Fastidiosipila sp.]|nr:hypothetical protein [Fastidiosipila sp.]